MVSSSNNSFRDNLGTNRDTDNSSLMITPPLMPPPLSMFFSLIFMSHGLMLLTLWLKDQHSFPLGPVLITFWAQPPAAHEYAQALGQHQPKEANLINVEISFDDKQGHLGSDSRANHLNQLHSRSSNSIVSFNAIMLIRCRRDFTLVYTN